MNGKILKKIPLSTGSVISYEMVFLWQILLPIIWCVSGLKDILALWLAIVITE